MNALRTKGLLFGLCVAMGVALLLTEGTLSIADNPGVPERSPTVIPPSLGNVVTSVVPLCCGEGEVVYATTMHQVFRSVNGGTWIEVTPAENVAAAQRTGNGGNSTRPTVMPPIPTVIRSVAPLCCEGTEIVYVTTLHRVFRSADGGASWTDVTPAPPATNE